MVRPQGDERAEHLVALSVHHGRFQTAGEVGGGFGAAGTVGRHGEEAAAQTKVDLLVHPLAVVGQLEHLVDGAGEVTTRLGDRATAARAIAGLRVGVGGFAAAVGLHEVRGDHRPVDEVGRRIGDEEVGHPSVHPAPLRPGLELVGHLALQLMAEPQAAGLAGGGQHPPCDECFQLGVDCLGRKVDRSLQQLAVDLAPDRGRGRGHGHTVRGGVQAGHQRLVEHVGDVTDIRVGVNRATTADELLEVERDPVAAIDQLQPGLPVEGTVVERVDQLDAVVSAQGLDLDGGAHRQGGSLPRREDDDEVAAPLAQQVAQQRERRLVEPLHVLDEQQARSASEAREDEALGRLGDLVVELATLGRRGVVAGLGGEAEHRREQRGGVVAETGRTQLLAQAA